MEVDIGLGLEDTHVLITGGQGAIGSITVAHFLKAGAKVSVFDIKLKDLTDDSVDPIYKDTTRYAQYIVDISDPVAVEAGFKKAIETFGLIQVCVALASRDLSYCPHHDSMLDMPFEQWKKTFEINVHGTFLTVQNWMRQVKKYAHKDSKNLSLIIIGSESGHFGELGNPDYASGKSAVQYGLLQSLRKDLVMIHPNARYVFFIYYY